MTAVKHPTPWTGALRNMAYMTCADLAALDGNLTSTEDLIASHFSIGVESVNNSIAMDFVGRTLDALGVTPATSQDKSDRIWGGALALFTDAAATIKLVTRGQPLQIVPGAKPVRADNGPDYTAEDLIAVLGHETARQIRVALFRNIDAILPEGVSAAVRPHLLSALKIKDATVERYPDIDTFHPAFTRDQDATFYRNVYGNILIAVGQAALSYGGDAFSPRTIQTLMAARDPYLALNDLRVYANDAPDLWNTVEELVAFSQMSALTAAMVVHDRAPRPVATKDDFNDMTVNLTHLGIVEAARRSLPEAAADYRALRPDLLADDVARMMVDPAGRGINADRQHNLDRLTAWLSPHFKSALVTASRFDGPVSQL